MSRTLDFMLKLRRIDDAGLTQRYVLVLWAVRETPGMMGLELTRKLGYKTRSNIQHSISVLVDKGLIEDRRIKTGNLTPNDLHITPAGDKFLSDLISD